MNQKELRRNFILLNVGYACHYADWNWKNISSPFIRIHYVKKGTARIRRGGEEYELKEKHLYLTPSYVMQTYECDGTLELYYIHIYEEMGNDPSLFDLIRFPVEIESDSLLIQLIERLIEINPDIELRQYDPQAYDNFPTISDYIARQQVASFVSDYETRGILNQILSRFMIQASFKKENMEPRVLKSLYYIHENIDRPIDIDCLAELCFLTKNHFIRLFKKEMHSTPGRYINRKKIEIAQLRILVKNRTVKDTAYSLGFENIPYFHRLFKKITGENPGEYKKKVTRNCV